MEKKTCYYFQMFSVSLNDLFLEGSSDMEMNSLKTDIFLKLHYVLGLMPVN